MGRWLDHSAYREYEASRHKLTVAALVWDEIPGDRDACIALSEACGAYRRAAAAVEAKG